MTKNKIKNTKPEVVEEVVETPEVEVEETTEVEEVEELKVVEPVVEHEPVVEKVVEEVKKPARVVGDDALYDELNNILENHTGTGLLKELKSINKFGYIMDILTNIKDTLLTTPIDENTLVGLHAKLYTGVCNLLNTQEEYTRRLVVKALLKIFEHYVSTYNLNMYNLMRGLDKIKLPEVDVNEYTYLIRVFTLLPFTNKPLSQINFDRADFRYGPVFKDYITSL